MREETCDELIGDGSDRCSLPAGHDGPHEGDSAIDYRDLLFRYIKHVRRMEGADYIWEINDEHEDPEAWPRSAIKFSDEERDILTEMHTWLVERES